MPLAILIADMAGFTALMKRIGARSGMETAIRFHDQGAGLARAFGGRLVSAWADNFMLAFPSVRQASAAAGELVAQTPSSVGIGWGEVIEGHGSLWGDEVNAASRLGEDVAKEGDVLLTDAAKARLEEERDGGDRPQVSA